MVGKSSTDFGKTDQITFKKLYFRSTKENGELRTTKTKYEAKSRVPPEVGKNQILSENNYDSVNRSTG